MWELLQRFHDKRTTAASEMEANSFFSPSAHAHVQSHDNKEAAADRSRGEGDVADQISKYNFPLEFIFQAQRLPHLEPVMVPLINSEVICHCAICAQDTGDQPPRGSGDGLVG